MSFIHQLHLLDQDLTLAVNSLHCSFSDAVWVLFSDRKIWYLLYLALTVLLFRRLGWKRALVVMVSVILTVVACDQLANLVKYSVARLRPCWDNYMVAGGLHRLEGKGSYYGFFSAHAANAFGIAASLVTGIRADRTRSYRLLGVLLYSWAALVSISRVFAGKHYLGDILVGTMAGLLVGYLLARLARWVIDKYSLSL